MSEDKSILLQQAIFAVSGIIFALFIMIIGNCDYTFLVISAILALLIGIVSLANSFLLAYNTYRSGVKGWKRIKQYIWVELGGAYMIFILFMETYKFWTL
jgi:multisubunit Na+/H+ antiporter MnhG subunit